MENRKLYESILADDISLRARHALENALYGAVDPWKLAEAYAEFFGLDEGTSMTESQKKVFQLAWKDYGENIASLY